jgi:hypothetical protein
LSVVFCYLRFISTDPLKGAYCLIFSRLFVAVFFSVFSYSWISYFLVLLFLSGVFFLMVYLSSLCSKGVYVVGGVVWFFFCCFYIGVRYYFVSFCGFGIVKYFLGGFIFYFFWVFVFLFFLFFIIRYYFRLFRGALRNF